MPRLPCRASPNRATPCHARPRILGHHDDLPTRARRVAIFENGPANIAAGFQLDDRVEVAGVDGSAASPIPMFRLGEVPARGDGVEPEAAVGPGEHFQARRGAVAE